MCGMVYFLKILNRGSLRTTFWGSLPWSTLIFFKFIPKDLICPRIQTGKNPCTRPDASQFLLCQNSAQAILGWKFWTICAIFLKICPHFFVVFLSQTLMISISEHIYMLICGIHTIFFIPSYTVLKDTAPGILASMVYWSRFDGGCPQNDQLLALVCLGPHAVGFCAVA